jgi:hypothetical protein
VERPALACAAMGVGQLAPHEVPLVNDEWAFIALLTPEIADAKQVPKTPLEVS